MIETATLDNAEDILSVINTSNAEAYKSVIPKEYSESPFYLSKSFCRISRG